jgi:hypothetical protein
VFRGFGGEGEPEQHGVHEGLHLQDSWPRHRGRQLTRQITPGKLYLVYDYAVFITGSSFFEYVSSTYLFVSLMVRTLPEYCG